MKTVHAPYALLVRWGLVALFVGAILLYTFNKGAARVETRNAKAQVGVLQDSADISLAAAETIGQRAAALSLESAKDHEVISNERAKRPSAAVRTSPVPDGVRQRADEAYAAAVCASLRVSGAHRSGPPPCSAEDD